MSFVLPTKLREPSRSVNVHVLLGPRNQGPSFLVCDPGRFRFETTTQFDSGSLRKRYRETSGHVRRNIAKYTDTWDQTCLRPLLRVGTRRKVWSILSPSESRVVRIYLRYRAQSVVVGLWRSFYQGRRSLDESSRTRI